MVTLEGTVRALIIGIIITLALLIANALTCIIVGTIVKAGFKVSTAGALLAAMTSFTMVLAGILGLEMAVLIIKLLRRLRLSEVESLNLE